MRWAALALGATLAGCHTRPVTTPPTPAAPTPATPAAPQPAPPFAAPHSLARNAADYRRDAATHLYGRHALRIYKGRMPPLLYAVGVVQTEIDRQGQVRRIHWMRAPRHAPEVMAEIERMLRAAAPYPKPLHMPSVTYTDVWLWHQSGRFQLDTLTEGQD